MYLAISSEFSRKREGKTEMKLVFQQRNLMERPPALWLLAGFGPLVSSPAQTLKLCESVATFRRPSYVSY